MSDDRPNSPEEENRPDDVPDGAPDDSGAGGEEARQEARSWRDRLGTTAGWLAVVAAIGICGLQGAGIVLRDRLERRQFVQQAPPLEVPGRPAAGPERALAEPGRFGPGVREVAVAGPATSDTAAGPAVLPTPEPPAPGPAEAPSARDETVTPPPAAPRAPSPQPEQPSPAASRADTETAEQWHGHALQVGIFRSQRYRRQMESQLETLGAPWFRTRHFREGEAYRLVATPADDTSRARALQILADRGVLSQETDGGIEAYFYLEEAAQGALQALADGGVAAGYGRFSGKIPVWTVFAGPFPDAGEAEHWKKRLAREGVPSYPRTRP